MAKVLISVDHKWRDLPAYVYVAMLLERKGHSVQLIRNGFESEYAVGTKADLIVMIHLYEKNRQLLARRLAEQGIQVVLMPTEGIPTLEGYRKFASGVDNDLSGVALHLVWNQVMADLLYRNKSLKKGAVRVIGCPRFDFYRPPLQTLLPKKSQFCDRNKLNPEWPIVTFATNFTQAQFYYKNQEFMKRDSDKHGYADVMKKISGSIEDVARRDYQSREILVSAFVRLVSETENTNFILKLHPSEDHEFYENLLSNELFKFRNRVRIIKREYIWDILSVSNLELKRSCTTGIESWMLGKPTIEMGLNPDEWYFSPEHASGSFVANTYEELKEKVDFYLAGGKVSGYLEGQRDVFLSKWCYVVDGQRAEAMVREISDLLLTNNVSKDIKFNFKKWFVWALLHFSDYRIHDLKIYGLRQMFSKNRKDKLGREDKFFNSSDVAYFRNKFSDLITKEIKR